MAHGWHAPDKESGDPQGNPLPSNEVWPMQITPPSQGSPFSANDAWPVPSGQGSDGLLPPGTQLPAAGNYKDIPSEQPSKAPPAMPVFNPGESSTERPHLLGGTTILYAGLGAGLGLARAGLFSEGITGSVLAGGVKFGAAGLGLGIAGGLIHYGLVKEHSLDIAYDGMLGGAALNVARVGLSGASRADLVTAGLKGGVTGFLVAGAVGIGAHELKKHNVL